MNLNISDFSLPSQRGSSGTEGDKRHPEDSRAMSDDEPEKTKPAEEKEEGAALVPDSVSSKSELERIFLTSSVCILMIFSTFRKPFSENENIFFFFRAQAIEDILRKDKSCLAEE